jgi:hypothetical protein
VTTRSSAGNLVAERAGVRRLAGAGRARDDDVLARPHGSRLELFQAEVDHPRVELVVERGEVLEVVAADR